MNWLLQPPTTMTMLILANILTFWRRFVRCDCCLDYSDLSPLSGHRLYWQFFHDFSQTIGPKCVNQTLKCV